MKIGEEYEGRKWAVVRISSKDFIVVNKKDKSKYKVSYDEFKDKFYVEKIKR